jgi:hypothetical protein
MLKIYIFIIVLFLFYYILNTKRIELFEQKLNIYEIAKKKYYNLKIYNKYLKYFNSIDYIDLSKIAINNNNKIFVSIASYRDSQCSVTLNDLLKKSNKPENLVIVICQQNDAEDEECINININTPAKIKLIKLLSKDARGPCWARFLIQQEWKGEEYYLQIDSHTRFVNNWDIKCIDNLKKLNNTLACLSNYVSTFNINTNEIEINPLRGPMFIESVDPTDGFFRYNSNYINFSDLKLLEPQESIGWSGCFSFSSSQIIKDAPYDPYTPFLFFGEEMDIFARLYTRNWIMYVPFEPICFTIFDRSYRKTFWEHNDYEGTSYLSKLRIYIRFGIFNNELNKFPTQIMKELDKYNLGSKKTFDDFLQYCNKKNIN